MLFPHAHAAVSLSLATVLWTVQLIIYPAFRFIDPSLFHKWHYRYTGAVTWIVAPLMFLQLGGVAGRLLALPKADALWYLEAALTALAWAVTVLISVPLHSLLQKERDEAAMRRLVRTNWLRTLAWSGTAACSWISAAGM